MLFWLVPGIAMVFLLLILASVIEIVKRILRKINTSFHLILEILLTLAFSSIGFLGALYLSGKGFGWW